MRPRIAVIGTGGSIATRGRHALDSFEYGAFSKPVEVTELLGMLADPLRDFDVVPVRFREIDSADMSPALWLELNRQISRTVESDASLSGIVITHGTSTLEETAYFLHLTTKVQVPVVLVGSQRPPNTLGSDAGINLLNALRVASTRAARALGVVVVMNDELHSARDVAKASNFRLDAFRTADFGALGTIDADGSVSIHRAPTRRHAPDTEFEVLNLTDLPAVEIVYCYAGATGLPVEALAEAGAQGIVFCGMPPGRPSPAQRAALAAATQRGVLVIQCSRSGSGRILQRADDRAMAFVAADTLTPQKARILAMLALCHTRDLKEIERMFAQY